MYTIQDLKSVIDNLEDGDRRFADSLIKADRSFGCSQKQLFWVDKLTRRAKGEDKPKSADVGSLAKVVEMFRVAKENGLKRPKIRFATFAISPASEQSRNAGMIYAKALDGEYLGKIDPERGQYFPARSASRDVSPELMAFASDPVQAATAYGHLTNNCCFCGHVLRDAESVRRGYGPICADRFGLAHRAAGRAIKVSVDQNLSVEVA